MRTKATDTVKRHCYQTMIGKLGCKRLNLNQRRQSMGAAKAQTDWCMRLPWRRRLEPQPWLVTLFGLLRFSPLEA